ncbi:MAG: glutaminyl-peptide cyclotransferase [Acidobacteriota bacterium]|nr:MAG: glutaminyl-peptide cyclotransferase [Acidobacteriota bacterium]
MSTAFGVEQATPEVLGFFPHDTDAFTQGLLLHNDSFYESTGLYGESTLRQVEPATGVVLMLHELSPSVFGEGLARVDDRLIQLTWQENIAYEYEIETFAETGTFKYAGEGWGLCFDGERLVMSNGSSTLFFRDPDTFAILGQVTVRKDGVPVIRLNELECVGDLVYANVWLTDTIMRIEADTGTVLTEIDASGLLTPEEAAQADVLNGIAFDPATEHFFLTGKLWPKVFEVRFDFNPYGEGCEVRWLREIEGVTLAKDGINGVAVSWNEDLRALEYHVNSVTSIDDVLPPGPHLPDVPGARGSLECFAPAGTTTCVDGDGQVDGEPLLFYQVYSACGPSGADEGPP